MTTAYEVLGRLNPFRYRGYVYDEETELYYLRSRYYNPTWDRFVNADVFLLFTYSMNRRSAFTYCHCSPISHLDINGSNEEYVLIHINAYFHDSTETGHIDFTIVDEGLTSRMTIMMDTD